MEYSSKFYNSILYNMQNAYAYHQILVDQNDKPIDYIFLDMNIAFEKITGLNKETTIGSKVSNVIPGIDKSDFDWIGFYGNIALNGLAENFIQYSKELNKWYSINVYSFEKYRFITLINDITDLKNNEIRLKEQNGLITNLYSELSATEEELRQQLDELVKYTDVIKTSEDRLNKAQAIAKVGNWELDLKTHIIWASKESFNIYGLTHDSSELPLKLVQKIVVPEDREIMDLALKELLENRKKYDLEFQIHRASDGEERIIRSIAEIQFDNLNRPLKVLGVIQDITEKKRYEQKLLQNNEELNSLYEELTASEEELRQQLEDIQLHKENLSFSEEKYRTLVDNSEDIIFSCDISGIFTAINKKFCAVSSLTPEDAIGKKFTSLIKSHILNKKFLDIIKDIKENPKTIVLEEEISFAGLRNHIYHITLTPVRNKSGLVAGITVACHDITQIRKNERKIKHLAYYDVVTGLPNRTLFTDRLNVAIGKAKRNNTQIAVMFLDIDNFKKINDTLGHSKGDLLLKELSERLKQCLRNYETVSRFSGDEFTIFIEDVEDKKNVISFIDRLKKVFVDCFIIDQHSLFISSSIGVSMYPDDGDTLEELLKNADAAMYKVKETGKNDFKFYNLNMKSEVNKKLVIEKFLRNALDNNELKLYFQPQIDAIGGKIRGCEALIRWSNDEFKNLSPIEFIPISEEAGFIIDIGEWVLRTACYINKQWQDNYSSNLVISVNISAIQLNQSNFSELVKEILTESELPPELLELEITESVLIGSFDTTLKMLEELKSLGVRISLDDFGSGYSSLNYLKQLPLNTLKIDKSFVEDIRSETKERAITRSIISLVHELNVEIIAEGVETEEQMEYLQHSNCDYIQGFLLYHPLTKDNMTNLIATGELNDSKGN